jgi:hypothetical protein
MGAWASGGSEGERQRSAAAACYEGRALRKLLLLWAVVLAAATGARAQELLELLSKGPMVQVENDAKGKFDKATAVIHISRPPADVWRAATDFAAYKTFLPKTLKSSPKPVGTNRVDVEYEIDTPMTNTSYTFRYEIDPDAMTMRGNWVKGDIKGSFCAWRLVPSGEGTLLYYTTASRNFSSIAQRLEDDQQTITVGVNVATALAVVKAVKRHVESAADAGH